MNQHQAQTFIDHLWDSSIVPSLTDYIRIPCKSPHFDADWQSNGYIEEGVQHIHEWLSNHKDEDMSLEVVRLPGRTPVILLDIPGQIDDSVLLYGHMDKQPEMEGWAEGLGPWIPVLKDGRLYGRGGADDGYAAYASLTAVLALRRQGIPHARCLMLIEACEESGSYDLPYYVEHLAERIGNPSLVICLDSGAGNYDQLWMTVSLRGMAAGTLRTDILSEGVHSGAASGVVPSSFRILRRLLNRVEDPDSGRVLLDELQTTIPLQRRQQVEKVAQQLGQQVHTSYPFTEGAQPMAENGAERILNRTWRPTLSVVGADGLPSIRDGGNVLRPYTALKLSFRLPPQVDSQKASERIKEVLETDPPYGARVSFEADQSADGWNAPPLAGWLETSLQEASQSIYGADALYMGEGGTIPFMAMLGDAYPEAQFMIAGVLGPHSNAHGPNEFIHIPYAKKLTTCVAQVLQDHFQRNL